MRGNKNFERPSMNLLGVADGNGHIGTAGRQVMPILGPDEERVREERLTPRPRRDVPRALDEIFRRPY